MSANSVVPHGELVPNVSRYCPGMEGVSAYPPQEAAAWLLRGVLEYTHEVCHSPRGHHRVEIVVPADDAPGVGDALTVFQSFTGGIMIRGAEMHYRPDVLDALGADPAADWLQDEQTAQLELVDPDQPSAELPLDLASMVSCLAPDSVYMLTGTLGEGVTFVGYEREVTDASVIVYDFFAPGTNVAQLAALDIPE